MTRLSSRVVRGAGLVLLVLTASGCFASVAQLDEVNEQLNTTRAEQAAVDSLRAMQLVQILTTLRAVNDSIASLSTRMTRLRAETQADSRGMRQELGQMVEVSGQSERRLKELRDQIEIRNKQTPPSMLPATPSGDTLTAPATNGAGPSDIELLQIGRDQLARGGNRAARAALTDLLQRFPNSELAPEAQFFIAEAFLAERAGASADTAYAAVVSTYPDSPRAPTAMYKRGVIAQTAARRTVARRLYNELIDKYPSSDEAELARERLRVLN